MTDPPEIRVGTGLRRMTNVEPRWFDAVRGMGSLIQAATDSTMPSAILTAVFGSRDTGLDLLGIHPAMAPDFGFDDTPETSAVWVALITSLATGLVAVPPSERPEGSWFV